MRPPRTWYFSGVLEEVDDFAQLFHGFIDAGHVVEGHPDVFLGQQLAAAAAEGHRRTGSAQPPENGDDNKRDMRGRDIR